MNDKCLLIGDIGGTNARFALATPDKPGFHSLLELEVEQFPTADDAISLYLDETGARRPDAVCLAAAGPVIDDAVDMTNNHWEISAAAISENFGTSAVRLLNDFCAIAYSIPFLAESDSVAIGSEEHFRLPEGDCNIAVLGPGTGLGIAGLRRQGGTLVPITGEGGHVGFAPETALQIEVLQVMRRKFDRVSTERLVAGSGLPDVYAALATIRGESRVPLTAAEIFAAAPTDKIAAETVDLFFEMLGQVAGDLALTLGAFDGVFVAGGIAKRYPEILERSRFRAAFESKGRYRPVLERIATRLITHGQPGLLGAAYAVLDVST